MKYAIFSLLLSISASADQKIFYLMDGKQTDVSTALIQSMKGQEVYKCQNVEAKPNKKGTSISLRNVKKTVSEN